MAKKFSLVLGAVLLILGIWGLLGGGQPHNLIVFGVNKVYNFWNIFAGIVGLVSGLAGERYAKYYCLIFSGLFAILTVGGLFKVASMVRLLNINGPGTVLHLVITAACFWIGMKSESA
jgi:hypothetical protein